jgi:hypothetical protein
MARDNNTSPSWQAINGLPAGTFGRFLEGINSTLVELDITQATPSVLYLPLASVNLSSCNRITGKNFPAVGPITNYETIFLRGKAVLNDNGSVITSSFETYSGTSTSFTTGYVLENGTLNSLSINCLQFIKAQYLGANANTRMRMCFVLETLPYRIV